MKITFSPGPGVKVIHHDKGVIINPPNDNGQASQEVKRSEARESGQKAKQEGVEGRRNGSMRPVEVRRILADLNIRLDEIEDKELAEAVRIVLQLLEQLSTAYEKMRVENQSLRDALNVLKGEQGQPKIKAKKKNKDEDKDDGDISSEKERKNREPRTEKKSKAKKHKIKIDRTEICPVDKSSLPDDVQFKGYRSVIVQEISLKTDNVEYQKEVYYSPSQNKTYTGQLPAGVTGEFGPGLKTRVYTQKHVANMSEPKIEEVLKTMGIYISAATISRILTKNNELFHQEKADIFQAGLASSRYQLIWDYYYQLFAYKANPLPEQAGELSAEFDKLFATKTGYQALDERIAKTRAKKESLLMVLKYPELPLHNNDSELKARVQARKRDVSLHTMSEDGTKANDTFLTIVRTAKKLGVNPYQYIYDRVSKRFLLPSLADLIKEKSLHNEDFFDTG